MDNQGITFSQFWFLSKKVCIDRNDNTISVETDDDGKITTVEYLDKNIKIVIGKRMDKLGISIKTFRDGRYNAEMTRQIKLPLFNSFSIYYWTWVIMTIRLKFLYRKKNKNKVNSKVQEINRAIAEGFPEDIEKELLK